MVGEISSGDTVMFAISSRKEETWVYNFCCFLFSALHINASVVTIVLGPEKCYFCP